ncbi:MAG: YgiQ family radical SAM protein [Clostridia bacterium]
MAINDFLPMTKEDMERRGWEQLDFLYISGDAYVDHPSFGPAIITRVLESSGYKVGIIAQPDWRNVEDFVKLGKPRLAVLVSSGNLDSMVNHYTASKKPRSDDAYSPGNKAGYRPDRAVIVYCNRIREAFKDVPIIIGGIEASLRRFAHYDYWENKVRRSVLIDSRSDLLIYGMGEKQIIQIADALHQGKQTSEITNIAGTVYLTNHLDNINGRMIMIPSYEQVRDDKTHYAEACKIQYEEQDSIRGKTIVQAHSDKYLVQNPPMAPLNRKELDAVYALPYQKTYHPKYEELGGIKAIKEVQFSIASSRGCFGSCTFCALTFHQGRTVQSRSKASIVNEAKNMIWNADFKGYIHDVGGPTANFRNESCEKQIKHGSCKSKQCLYPSPCKKLNISHDEYLEVLRELRNLEGVKKVFIRSGIRYDYLMHDRQDDFFWELCEHHVSGQLKVAPEHVSPEVLKRMGKPSRQVYQKFADKFYQINKKIGKEQYLVPYLMSSHPGSGLKEAIELAEYLRDNKYYPEQVQDFYPTPGTLATCMFYTGLDPRTMEEVYVPRSPREKAMQRALLQYRNPANYELVYEALIKEGRKDLIGFGQKCLIRPRRQRDNHGEYSKKDNSQTVKKKNIQRGRK